MVIFMAMAFDMIMVHYMTAAGSPLAQADVLNLSLPSASLSLGITATVLAAHREHYFQRPGGHDIERPIEEQFERAIDTDLVRSTNDHFEIGSDVTSATSTDRHCDRQTGRC